MTDDQARRIANVVIGAAAAGAAIYVLRTPPLRRLAWRLAVTAVTGPVAAWFMAELRTAWEESARSGPPGARSPRDMMRV
jgi:hypothetical protein